jgi:hypothetical protein
VSSCDLEPFVADVTPQAGSLQEAASAQELTIQQLQGYLQRLKTAICTDIQDLQAQIDAVVGATSFLGLSDTPASYAGAAGDVVSVNAGETALEFTTPAGGGGLPDLADGVEVSSGRMVVGNPTFFKLVDIGNLPNTTTTTTAHGIGAAFALVHAYGVGNNPTIPNSIPLIFATTGAASNVVWFYTDATNINVVAGINRSAFTNSFIVLEYYYL